jgi:hypothetical protein
LADSFEAMHQCGHMTQYAPQEFLSLALEATTEQHMQEHQRLAKEAAREQKRQGKKVSSDFTLSPPRLLLLSSLILKIEDESNSSSFGEIDLPGTLNRVPSAIDNIATVQDIRLWDGGDISLDEHFQKEGEPQRCLPLPRWSTTTPHCSLLSRSKGLLDAGVS